MERKEKWVILQHHTTLVACKQFIAISARELFVPEIELIRLSKRRDRGFGEGYYCTEAGGVRMEKSSTPRKTGSKEIQIADESSHPPPQRHRTPRVSPSYSSPPPSKKKYLLAPPFFPLSGSPYFFKNNKRDGMVSGKRVGDRPDGEESPRWKAPPRGRDRVVPEGGRGRCRPKNDADEENDGRERARRPAEKDQKKGKKQAQLDPQPPNAEFRCAT